MKKLNKFVIIYFLSVLPLLAVMELTDLSHSLYEKANTEVWADWLNGGLGFAMGLWMTIAIYLGIALVSSQNFREELLKKIVRVKERDERESLVAGIAAKKVFFSSIALVSLLLALSMFQVNVKKLPEGQQVNGHKNVLSLGVGFAPLKTHYEDQKKPDDERFSYFFPFTPSGILLFMLSWQLLTFHWYSRKAFK